MKDNKTPDEKFLDAEIALLMNASPEELDEYLVAAGLDPQDLETRGMNAVKGALTNGLTVEEIKEILLHATVYCGIPAGLEAFKAAHEVLKAEGALPSK